MKERPGSEGEAGKSRRGRNVNMTPQSEGEAAMST